MDKYEARLHKLVRDGSMRRLRKFFEKHPKKSALALHARDERGFTALHVAARAGFADVCRYLLRHDAELCSVHASSGDTALHIAARLNFADVILACRQHERRQHVANSAMQLANRRGLSAEQLLQAHENQALRREAQQRAQSRDAQQRAHAMRHDEQVDEEREWREKMLGETFVSGGDFQPSWHDELDEMVSGGGGGDDGGTEARESDRLAALSDDEYAAYIRAGAWMAHNREQVQRQEAAAKQKREREQVRWRRSARRPRCQRRARRCRRSAPARRRHKNECGSWRRPSGSDATAHCASTNWPITSSAGRRLWSD